MNIVFIVGIIESLFFFFVISSKKKNNNIDKVLSAWLLLIALNLLIPLFIYTDKLKYIHLNGIDYSLLVLHPMLLFIYTKLLLSKDKKIKIKYILHASIFIVNCLLVIPYIFMDKETKFGFLYDSAFLPIVWIGTIWVTIVFLSYLCITSLLVMHYQKNLRNQYSFTEDVNLNWLKYLTIGLIVVFLLGSVVGSILCYIGIPLYYINYFVYTSLVVFVFGIGFFGIKQKNVFTYDIPEEKDHNKKTALVTQKDKLFAKNLELYMVKQKPYLNEKLTLHELAESLGVKPYYVTFILNKVINKKFFDFINYYRVEEIKTRIKDGQISKFTILSIAFDCGFNSKASFNRIFKSFTGYSPTEYINSFSTHST